MERVGSLGGNETVMERVKRRRRRNTLIYIRACLPELTPAPGSDPKISISKNEKSVIFIWNLILSDNTENFSDTN